jgi:hypothetical protein
VSDSRSSSGIIGNHEPIAEDTLNNNVVDGEEDSLAGKANLERERTGGQGTLLS